MANSPSPECNFLSSSYVQGVGEGVMRMILILNAPAGTKREQIRTRQLEQNVNKLERELEQNVNKNCA
jgi:hypothetical protein